MNPLCRHSLRWIGIGLLASPMMVSSLSACPACLGNSDAMMIQGMNAGIILLVAVVGGVLAVISSFFVFLARRSRSSDELNCTTD